MLLLLDGRPMYALEIGQLVADASRETVAFIRRNILPFQEPDGAARIQAVLTPIEEQ